jgi:hypothetical protein
MGVPRAPRDGATADAEAFFQALALENRPVEPDVVYAPGIEDVTDHGRGWLAAVDAALFPAQAAAPVASAPAPAGPPESAPATAQPAKVPAAVETGTPAEPPPPTVTSPPRP